MTALFGGDPFAELRGEGTEGGSGARTTGVTNLVDLILVFLAQCIGDRSPVLTDRKSVV